MSKALFTLALLSSVLTLTPIAKADTLDFTITGLGNTYTFSLPSDPIPDSYVLGISFTLDSISVTEDGGTANTANVEFRNSNNLPGAVGGVLIFGPDAGSVALNLFGPQLYTSIERHPTFILGDDIPLSDHFTIDIDAAPSPAPEPSSFALFGTGALAFAGAARRKLFAQ
jgi:hypothetical protein